MFLLILNNIEQPRVKIPLLTIIFFYFSKHSLLIANAKLRIVFVVVCVCTLAQAFTERRWICYPFGIFIVHGDKHESQRVMTKSRTITLRRPRAAIKLSSTEHETQSGTSSLKAIEWRSITAWQRKQKPKK